jgi:tRNA threonylcarbamoyladenosine biosynthesis protein TsaB
MTRILALETAGETCSVAIMDGGEVLEHFEQAPRRQTERVLPMVEEAIKK